MAGAASGSGTAMGVLTSMMAGLIFWGGVGWLLDRWWGTEFLAALGAVLGLALSTYIVVVKYGQADSAARTGDRKPEDTGVDEATTREESV